MKLAVFAYHDIGYECLKVLIDCGEEIVAVVTHEDDPREEIWFRSVAELAGSHQLPVYAPRDPNTPAFIDLIRSLAPDLILSFYYRRLLSKELLAVPRLGGINLHGSLLPKYRGRCPVNWVLINGERETGVTLHHMIEEADAGDIIAQIAVPIRIEDTAQSLFYNLTAAAVELCRDTYPRIKKGTARRVPQNPKIATTFGGRRAQDGRVAWERPAWEIYNLIRAVTHPYPGAFTYYKGKKLYLWGAIFRDQSSSSNGRCPGTIEAIAEGKGTIVAAGDGTLLVTRMQFEGEEEMRADELLQRYSLPIGTGLGA